MKYEDIKEGMVFINIEHGWSYYTINTHNGYCWDLVWENGTTGCIDKELWEKNFIFKFQLSKEYKIIKDIKEWVDNEQ